MVASEFVEAALVFSLVLGWRGLGFSDRWRGLGFSDRLF